jgi:hypothetical protein
VIAIQGYTIYEIWTDAKGIEKELSPTNTHESNGGAERAGQEVINRSIKMRLGANIPEHLWPESTLAAIHLYNKSPSDAHTDEEEEMRSPNERLDSWFRNYFRWYDPELINKITADLRPNWNGIYVYGARAYPLIKEREAGKQKRAFKVKARGHIGYLVGYYASNIYRIWVPELDRVIITRNVTFDEDILYAPEQEKAEGQPLKIIQDIVEMIEMDIEYQDAGSILENLELWDTELVEQNNTVQELGGAPDMESELSIKVPMSQKSGVVPTRDSGTGLLSPELTPAPESMPAQDSGDFTGNSESTDHNDRDSDGRADPTPTEDTRSPQAIIWQGASPPTDLSFTEADQTTSVDPSEVLTDAEEETTIVVAHPSDPKGATNAKPKRKYVRKTYEKTRSSSRNRGPKHDKGDGDQGGASTGAVFAVSSSTLLAILIKDDPAWAVPENLDSFLSTFWPIQEDVTMNGALYRTVHATIAESVLQNHAPRDNPSIPYIHQSILPKEPKSWRDLEKHPLGEHFKADAELELRNLESRDCWRVIPRSEAKTQPIPLKWVFTYKTDSEGMLTRCRSRIVVRGDLQDSETVLSTYAATLASRSFRMAMAIAAHFDLEAKQYDVVNAFINARRGPESAPVTCHLPDGFKREGMVVELDRALYGLVDSPALWYKEWTSTLSKLGLVPCFEEPCIFVNELRTVFVVFYVDDVQLLYHKDNQAEAQALLTGIKGAYELHNLGDVKWFLGVRVVRDRAAKKIWLAHDTYIEKVAKRFDLIDGKCPSTPLPFFELKKNTDQAPRHLIKLYQEKVGSVLYTAITLRPDVAFAASQLSHFLTNPSIEHMAAVDWTIRYLFGTRFLGIMYSGDLSNTDLVIASDASFADDVETRRSSHGYTISLFGGLIAWKAARQDTVTTSTTEAELKGVGSTAKETMALKRLFKEIQLDLGQLWTIFCDNQQAIRLIVGDNERISTKLRHVDIQNMWLRQEHKRGSFQVLYLPTLDMPADGLTKNLPRFKFEHFRNLLKLQDIRAMLPESGQSTTLTE